MAKNFARTTLATEGNLLTQFRDLQDALSQCEQERDAVRRLARLLEAA